jgi:endonuclease/exonuclease/phosphatase family metal-dependent hydrolase
VALAVAAPSARAETVTVLTYNLGLLRAFGSDLVPLVAARAEAAPRALAALAEAERPQVVLLEEVWRDSYAAAIVKALSPLGYAAVKPSVHSIIGLNSGLLLLVKAPLKITEWKFSRFKRTTFMDSFAMKGVLQAVVEDAETGSCFVVVGTHTVAVDTVNGAPKDSRQVAAIMAQADQILEALHSRSASSAVPALLLGDFNVGPGYVDSAYRKIARSDSLREAGAELFPDSPLVTWDPQNPLVKYGNYPEEPPAKIDHIFLQNGVTGKWTVQEARVVMKDPADGVRIAPKGGAPAPAPLSDHYAFLAVLDLN